jgi:TRAP-type C4-dicarboxylate transport system substrate-binding protein
MKHRSSVLVSNLVSVLAAALALAVVGTTAVGNTSAQPPAATPTTIRIATLAPRSSPPYRVLNAWANSVREQSGGQLLLHIESGADEAAFVHRFQAHEIEAVAVTSVGLSTLCRPVLVLQAPGVVEDYTQMDRARAALDATLRAELATSGYTLLGWGEAGQGRIFSTRAITSPSDVAAGHPWLLPGNPILEEFLSQAHATGVPLGLAGVLGALGDHRVDVVMGSATIIDALQWHTRLTHVIRGSRSVLMGATLISRSTYEGLPAAQRTILDTTAAQAHARLLQNIRASDTRAYATLLSHGMIETDASSQDAAWTAVAQATRRALAGRLYTPALLAAAWTAAGHTGAP